MTQYAFTLQPLNDAAQKSYWGKTYTTSANAYRALHWFRSHVPDAFFAVRRCTITTDDSGCEVVTYVGERL